MKALVFIVGFLLFLMPSLVSGKQRRGLDLVLYYPFDEVRGRATKDLSRFRNDGQLQGKWAWRKGKFGHALYFVEKWLVVPTRVLSKPHSTKFLLLQQETK